MNWWSCLPTHSLRFQWREAPCEHPRTNIRWVELERPVPKELYLEILENRRT